MLKNIFISIKTKVAISIAITLIFVGLSIYITTNYYLTKIINKSQYAIYNSKIEDIINSLKIKNRQLEKTERVDSYLESFQKNVINEIRAKYYSSNNLEAYPIIMSFDRSVIMHPKLPWGYDKLKNSDFINMLYNLNEGQANYSYENTKKWIVIKNFDKWKWKIAYTVPLKIKYADLANFRNKFFLIFVIILLLTLFMFILIASKLIKPLKVLTDASEALTEGKKADLNLIITNDEVGILAKRFIKMNESINKQFDVINSQKAKTTQIKNYLSNIVNSMPSILIGIDSNFRITQWNLEAQNKTGFTEEIAIGKNLKDLIPRLFPYFDKIKNAIKNRKPYLANNTLYKNNDKIIYENIGIYPLIANGVQGAVIRIDDITKQYQMEQQLNQSRKMDAIGQLAGGVAHDFNNMLTGISGAAQLLQLPKHNLSSKGLNLVDMILNASQRAAELTAKLLAFGRKEELTFEAIDINEIIDSTIEIFNRTIDKKSK
jgi:PAS domain S-box-containing protein